MADTKISALTALTGANVEAAADVVPIVDTSVTTTKKILVSELAIGIGLVPGIVVPYAGTAAPTGWLLCYGQVVAQATYPALYAILGTTYGSDAGGNFTLPDLRGRVVAGQDDMGGSSADRLTGQTNGVNGDTLAATGGIETTSISGISNNGTLSVGGGTVADFNQLGTNPLNNVQPTIILNYLIKT